MKSWILRWQWILLAVVIALLYWILEAVVMIGAFGNGSFAEQMFSLEVHELWMRSLTTALILGFGAYVQAVSDRRHRLEEELRVTSERYHLLWERSSDAMFLVDPADGRYLNANPAAERLVGRTITEIKTLTTADLAPTRAQERLKDAKPSDESVDHGEVTYISPSGSERTALLTTIPMSGDLMIGIARDITGRKQMEEEREFVIELLSTMNSSNDLHSLMRDVLLLIKNWTGCDAVGIRLQEGHDFPYYEVSGFSAEHVLVENSLCTRDSAGEVILDDLGNPVLECMCGNILCGRFDPSRPFFTEYGSFWSNCTTELLASTTEEDRLARTRNICNGEGYESVMLIPLRYGDETFGLLQVNDKRRDFLTAESRSQVERMAGSIAMAIAQRRTQKELLKNHGELAKAQETAHLGNYEWNIDSGEFAGSDEMYRLLGVDPEKLGGAITFEDATKRVHPDDAPRISELAKRVSEGRASLPIEYRVVRPDGTERTLEGVIEATLDEDNKPSTVMGTMQDVTDRKRMEAQVSQSQLLASLGEMTAGIAHEVNNPLAAILLYSELVNQTKLSPAVKKDLTVIRSEARRASNIMKNLLTYSRKAAPITQRMDIHKTLKKVIDMRRYQENVRNINIDARMADGPLRVHGSAAQLTQVFMNLIINAEEAVENSGDKRITVSTEADADRVKISIADSGVGIPEGNLTQVFVPFFSTKPTGKGTGLGLATCHGIVTAHGGMIRAENNDMGGATFIVELPLAR